MPTELPPGFKGTGKRSTPNPPIPTEIRLPPARTEVEDDSDDLPGWAKLIGILVMMIGSWVLVGWAFWVIKHLAAFALGLTS